jgi:Protein of unknown function (DUF1574)
MARRGSRSAQRPRKVLLWAVATFFGLQLIIGLALDYCWPLLRFPSARKTMARLAAEPGKPEIVFLGSSRLKAGIVPEEVGPLLSWQCRTERPVRVFNASVPFGDVISAEYVFQLLLDRGVRPTLVVLEVSPEQLNSWDDWIGVHIRRQFRWHDAPTYLLEICRANQLAFWLGERINPLYYNREDLWADADDAVREATGGKETGELAAVRPQPIDNSGPPWEELLRPANVVEAPEKQELSRNGILHLQRWLRRFHVGGNRANALERILARCRDMGTEVLLVQAPVTLGHRQAYAPEINQEYLAYVQRLTRIYGCRFVDYRDRAPDNLFEDDHHLRSEGGVFFSRLLTFEVLAPFWQARLGNHEMQLARRK